MRTAFQAFRERGLNMPHTDKIFTLKAMLTCLVFAACFALISSAVFAQAGTTLSAGQRVVRPMVPLDPVTLQVEGISIRLWGIKAAQTRETPLELRAMDFIEKMINNDVVSCRIEKVDRGIPYARCTTHSSDEINLALLQSGFAVVDRHQTYGSVFASAYEDAQITARDRRAGVWEFVVAEDRDKLIPDWLDPYMSSLVPLSLIFGPLTGLALIALAARQGFRNMIKRQEMEFKETREKEEALLRREKLVLASAIEGELSENKVKIEAFLTIYHDLLKELQDDSVTPKYQRSGGDLIHKHPALNRTVFEGSISKLSALDMQLASTLSKLYAYIHAEPDYITIDSKMPHGEVLSLMQKTIQTTEALIPQIDFALEQLSSMIQKQMGGADDTKKKQQPPRGPVAQKPEAAAAQKAAAPAAQAQQQQAQAQKPPQAQAPAGQAPAGQQGQPPQAQSGGATS
ncbi:MAG: hypothetical protein D8M28_06645 [Proteobacteria bacterium]|nr:hypothetical protein [Pseudomonadota bacterium]